MFSKVFTTVRYCLVFVNFLFLITGIIILSVGSSVQSAYNQYHEFLSERFFSLPAFCIATGVIIFLIAFAGFYGALMESYSMNMVFVGAMILIFIFQLSACIAGYVLRGSTEALIHKQLTETMDLYPDGSASVTRLWDEVQQDFICCGVSGPGDWPPHLNQDNNANNHVPISCCSKPVGAVGTFTCDTASAYQTGCAAAFGSFVRGHVTSIGVTGIFLVLFQALAVVGAIWIAKMARDPDYAM